MFYHLAIIALFDNIKYALRLEHKFPLNETKHSTFCQLKYLIECTVALIQQVDNVEQCYDVYRTAQMFDGGKF